MYNPYNSGQYHRNMPPYDLHRDEDRAPPPTTAFCSSWPVPSPTSISLPGLPPHRLHTPTSVHVPPWFQTDIHKSFSEPLLRGATAYYPRGRPITSQRFDDTKVQFSRHPKSPSDHRRYLTSQMEPPYRKTSAAAHDWNPHRHSRLYTDFAETGQVQPTVGGEGTVMSDRPARAQKSMNNPSRRRHAPVRPTIEMNHFDSPSRRHAPVRPTIKMNQALHVTKSTQISVLSYNMLAQDLISTNRYLYSKRPQSSLDWNFRKSNLLIELTQAAADILCLQEVQEDCFNSWFSPQLSQCGYTGLYKQRTGTHTDGCAVFYKQEKFKLLDYKGVEFRRDFKILNRDNVGLVAKFYSLQNGEAASFCVATTHLLFNPKAGEVKLAQLSCLLAELHKMAIIPGKEELLPAIFCGDVNSTPGSPLYNFITTSYLNYSKMSAVEIAGYYNSRRNTRVIPKPLLPASMNIGGDCRFNVITESQPTAVVVDLTVDSAPDDVTVIDDSGCTNDGTFISLIAVVAQKAEGDAETPSKFTSSQSITTGYGALGQTFSKEKSGSVSVMEWESEKQPAIDLSQARHLNPSVDKPVITSEGLSPAFDQHQVKDFKNSVSSDDKRDVSLSGVLSLNSESNPRRNADSSTPNPNNKQRQSTLPNGLLTHPFRFNSVYPYSSQSPRSTVTTFHQSAFETVDYIFYTPTSSLSNRGLGSTGEPSKLSSGFHLLSRKVLPSTHILLELGPQPHEFLSSDHLLLQATFQLVF